MFKRTGFVLLVLVLAVIAAGCSSGTANVEPTESPEMLAARNSTMENAAIVNSLEGAYAKVGSDIAAASFTPPPQLNKAAVDADIATVDSYSAALADYRTASARYRSFLDNGSAEYRQATDNETAAEAKLQGVADLKKELGLINDWLAEYAIWGPVNDTAGQRAKEMLMLASINDPHSQLKPQDGVSFFNQARPQFITYLNESARMVNQTDALIGAMDNSTARSSLVQFGNDVESMNDWVRTNYNVMVDMFNSQTNGRFGTQERIS